MALIRRARYRKGRCSYVDLPTFLEKALGWACLSLSLAIVSFFRENRGSDHEKMLDRLRVPLLARRHGAITQLADDLRLMAHKIGQVEYSGDIHNANGGHCRT